MLSTDELEAILFVAGDEGVTCGMLQQSLGIESDHIENIFNELSSVCEASSRPYAAIRVKNTMSLVTKARYSGIIASVRAEVERQPLSKSHVEVLSLLLYGGATTKTDIDTYRGVNSGQSLRALAVRGMVEKTGMSHGSPVYSYTRDVLHMVGLQTVEDLPRYAELKDNLQSAVVSE